MNNEEKILSLLVAIQAEQKEMKEELNTRFKNIEEKFNARFESIEKKFNTRFESIEEKFNARFESMEEKFNTRFESIEEKFNTRLEGIEEELANLKEQVAENTSILKAVEHRGEITSAELQGFKLEMFKELGAIKADLNSFKKETKENFENVATKEDLKDIAPMKEMLMEHELKFRRMKIS